MARKNAQRAAMRGDFLDIEHGQPVSRKNLLNGQK
jgi:hypothetical protein